MTHDELAELEFVAELGKITLEAAVEYKRQADILAAYLGKLASICQRLPGSKSGDVVMAVESAQCALRAFRLMDQSQAISFTPNFPPLQDAVR
jgi:hypothetical protein